MSAGATVGLVVLFLGYSVTYYGLTQVQGGNWGYFDLLLPSRWPAKAGVARDAPQNQNASQPNATPLGYGKRAVQVITGLVPGF